MRWGTVCESAWCSPRQSSAVTPSAVRAYGQRVEELGFTHLLAYDHVVGADPAVHTGWSGPYDVHTTFHEPLVMFGYLAAVTTTLELVTGVIILPQRQAVLVAKQAAEVDLLSEGRLRLGVGTRLERRRVRGARRGLHQPRQAVGRTGRADAAAVDRADGDVRRHAPSGDRRGPCAAAGATADPGVDRCRIAAGARSAQAGWPTDGSR